MRRAEDSTLALHPAWLGLSTGTGQRARGRLQKPERHLRKEYFSSEDGLSTWCEAAVPLFAPETPSA